jgi:N-methylhydantoinase A
MTLRKLQRDVRQHQVRHGSRATDCDRAGRRLAFGAELVLHAFQLLDGFLAVAVETLAEDGQSRPAGATIEQFHLYRLFQGLDRLGERRLRDVQVLSRAQEASSVGHGDQVPELSHVHRRHITFSYTDGYQSYWTCKPRSGNCPRRISGLTEGFNRMAFAVAVDIGGTFTDLVGYDRLAGRVVYTKSPTTYDNFAKGIFDCFGKAGLDAHAVDFFNHGTTLVINALIQRRGAKAALVTTSGFRDIIEIARGNRPDPFDLRFRRDEPLIPRELRFELDERIDSIGKVLTSLDPLEVERLADRLKALGIEAVAVCFLNSYVNSTHEEVTAKVLQARLPGAYVTCSAELTREWYEYERSSTVAANAYVGPQVTSYVRRLENELATKGFEGSLSLMGSNGGLLSIDRACQQPIGLVESGPIGGCIGAGSYAEALGFENVIAFDMGGTTAKCALIDNQGFSVSSVYYVGGYAKGFPIRSPVIDIVEVGSGGGSIARLDAQNRLHVGPESAGSTPGPACYGRGGAEPTVTDANLVLGRLSPDRFLGGELRLDAEAAQRAIARIATALGYTGPNGTVRMAQGILSLAGVIMAGAIKQISVQHGRDPRDFVLFCYGGGGPLHAGALARELSIPMIVIPPEPGNFSAIGMLLADARIDLSTTFVGTLDEHLVAALHASFDDMERTAHAAMMRDFGPDEVVFERHAEMRYAGQRHNIKVRVPNQADAPALREAFECDYRRRYGHADAKAAAEVQALHLAALARLQRPDLRRLPRESAPDERPAIRSVCFDAADGMIDTEVYQRAALPVGFRGLGPALIEEYGSTTLVWPGDHFEIGALGEIRIRTAVADGR